MLRFAPSEKQISSPSAQKNRQLTLSVFEIFCYFKVNCSGSLFIYVLFLHKAKVKYIEFLVAVKVSILPV